MEQTVFDGIEEIEDDVAMQVKEEFSLASSFDQWGTYLPGLGTVVI